MCVNKTPILSSERRIECQSDIKHLKKKYSDIPGIIDHILPKKYKAMNIKIKFVNSKLKMFTRVYSMGVNSSYKDNETISIWNA